MARFSLVVLTQAQPGREDEFRHWYDTQHVPDVLRVPGVVAAQRFDIPLVKSYLENTPAWTSLAIYELEAEDPQTVMDAIVARRDTADMIMTDSLLPTSTVQVVGKLSPNTRR
jgi:hypothetical protein